MLGALGAPGKRTLICQSMLSYILESVHLDSVIVLQYIDDVSIIGNGKSRVRSAVSDLCRALQEAGAVTSVKSILEPVPEIRWLDTYLVLFGPSAGVFGFVGFVD